MYPITVDINFLAFREMEQLEENEDKKVLGSDEGNNEEAASMTKSQLKKMRKKEKWLQVKSQKRCEENKLIMNINGTNFPY